MFVDWLCMLIFTCVSRREASLIESWFLHGFPRKHLKMFLPLLHRVAWDDCMALCFVQLPMCIGNSMPTFFMIC